MDRYMASYIAESAPFHSERPSRRPADRDGQSAGYMRVPPVAEDPATNLLQWYGLFKSMLMPRTPLVLIVNLTAGWVDVLAGRPIGPDFYCLRADRQVMPLVTDIPYEIDAVFTARVHAFTAANRASS